MKNLFAALLIVALSLVGIAHPSLPDRVEANDPAEESTVTRDDAQSKDMYLAYTSDSKKSKKKRRGRPGARVWIELRRDGVTRVVPVDTTFQAGDKVKFHFAVNFPAHVSVINLGSSGRLKLLFPYQGAPEVVSVTKNYAVPHSNDLWFEFDNTPGTERLTFIFSAVRLMASIAPSSQTQTISSANGSVIVNPTSDQQAALNDLNSRALANGKDLNLVQVSSEENYVLCDEQQLGRPIGFQIALKHK